MGKEQSRTKQEISRFLLFLFFVSPFPLIRSTTPGEREYEASQTRRLDDKTHQMNRSIRQGSKK
jgi:hypothetical protein